MVFVLSIQARWPAAVLTCVRPLARNLLRRSWAVAKHLGNLSMQNAPEFNQVFREQLEQLFVWRRDVRRFNGDAIDPAILQKIVSLACLAPSVGFSQPWRFVLVESSDRRDAIRENFEQCNREALRDYEGERAKLYASLKLAGLDEAPVHLAVFVDEATATGRGLGRKTMPEMLRYSAVMAVHAFWLAARAHGIGVGWVSILDPDCVKRILDAPSTWTLIAYLCVGKPAEDNIRPQLERAGWETVDTESSAIVPR
jgi:5,6-dimethylbenzimidazole synthase